MKLFTKLSCAGLILSMTFTAAAADEPVTKTGTYKDSRGNEVIVPENAWATSVVEFTPGNPWTKKKENMNPEICLGQPDKKDYTLGSFGSVVLGFDILIRDGEGDDIYVFEYGGDVEPTKVEVSSDLQTWYDVGIADGSVSSVDLNGKVPEGAKFKYVRITDNGKTRSGDWPGADIDAVAGLNVKEAAAGSEWANSELEEADMAGLIPETMENKDMTGPITRGEFAALSVKLYEALSGNKTDAVQTPFGDIADNENVNDISKAYGQGIAIGVSETEFAPYDKITREQLATMLSRTVKKYKFSDWTIMTDGDYYLDTDGVEAFNDDADISDYARQSVYYMAKTGIIRGMDGNIFAPRNITAEQEAIGYASATREQALALALRIFRLGEAL